MLPFFYLLLTALFTPSCPTLEPNHTVAPGIIWSSINLGESWQNYSTGIEETNHVHDILNIGQNQYLSVGKKIYSKESNFPTRDWQVVMEGNKEFVSLYKDGSKTLAVTYPNGLTEIDLQQKKERQPFGEMVKHHITSSYTINEQTYLLFTHNGIFKSFDGGQSWTNVSPIPAYNHITVSNGPILAIGPTGILTSNDNGDHWSTSYFNGKSVVSIEKSENTIVALCHHYPSQEDQLLVPYLQNRSDIMVSHDLGKTWEKLELNTEDQITDVCLIGEKIFYTIGNKIFATNNGGRSWKLIKTFEQFDAIKLETDGQTLFVCKWFDGC